MSFKIFCRVTKNNPPKIWLISYLCDNSYFRYRDSCSYIHGKLIDIGCGTKPYQDFWRSVVTEHIGVDHASTLHDKSNIDIEGSAYAIPVENESFDSAICNAVLEHLEEPEMALRECHRILKKGGIAIYSVPFIWHVHEAPRDFYRFSQFGLKYLFEKVGFEVVEINALSGFWVTFGQLFVYNLYRLNKGIIARTFIIDLIGIFIQIFSYILDKIDKSEQWTWMNIIVVRKI